MTDGFLELPSPHPDERALAAARAAPLIGHIILCWNDIERDMRNELLHVRHHVDTDRPLDRSIANAFMSNLDEWFVRLRVDSGLSLRIKHEAKELSGIRNDLSHNIWIVRLDTELGVAINIVKERPRFFIDDARWLADRILKGRRSQRTEPAFYRRYTLLEADLYRTVVRIQELHDVMRQAAHEFHLGRQR